MTTAYTSLLGLALPVTGELSGTWGDTVNNSITSLVDTAVAGTTNVSADSNVTLTTTTGASNQARQAILLFSGARTAIRTVTAPAQSKIYTVINATTGGFAVQLVGAGPTTGLTIPNGASAVVAWNGSDFVEIGASTIGNLTVNGNLGVGAAALSSNYSGSATVSSVKGNGSNKIGTFIAQSFGSVNTTNIEMFASDIVNEVGFLTKSAATPMTFYTGSAPDKRMTLDASGNLGLGLTPVGSWGTQAMMFAKSGASNQTYPFIASTDTQTLTIGSNSYWDGTNWKAAFAGSAVVAMQQRVNYNGISWHTAPAVSQNSTQTFTQAMILDTSGELRIGATSDGGKLTLSGATGFAGTGLSIYETSTGNNARLRISQDTALAIYDATYSSGGNAHVWQIGGTNVARINSGGSFMVGTTAPITVAGIAASHTMATSTSNAWVTSFVTSTAGTPWGLGILYSAASPNNSSSDFIYCFDSTALRMAVKSNGGISNYQANDANLSDRREKTNFAPAGSYLDKICAIPVQTFNYIDQNIEEDGGLTLGVVAQDVQAVAPELVMESNWAGKDEAPKMRLSIYQTDLQYALMKCIQEQQAIIESLKARLDAANL